MTNPNEIAPGLFYRSDASVSARAMAGLRAVIRGAKTMEELSADVEKELVNAGFLYPNGNPTPKGKEASAASDKSAVHSWNKERIT